MIEFEANATEVKLFKSCTHPFVEIGAMALSLLIYVIFCCLRRNNNSYNWRKKNRLSSHQFRCVQNFSCALCFSFLAPHQPNKYKNGTGKNLVPSQFKWCIILFSFWKFACRFNLSLFSFCVSFLCILVCVSKRFAWISTHIYKLSLPHSEMKNEEKK